MRAAVGLVVATLLVRAAVAGSAPEIGKLDGAPDPPAAETEAPRRLPRTAAVCQDPAGRRCWVAGTEAACRPDGEIFRLVIDAPSEVDEAVARCRAQWN
jgi:hypothetical protein